MIIPASDATITDMYDPTGPPNWYPSAPATADEMITNGAQAKPFAMARPIHAPTKGDFADKASAMKLMESLQSAR